MRHVHGRALHLRELEPDLQMQVVHVLKELAKVPASGADVLVVVEMIQRAEEPHETATEVSHETVVRWFDTVVAVVVVPVPVPVAILVLRRPAPGVREYFRSRGRQFWHYPVRIYFERVEHEPFAPGQPDHLAPGVFAVLQLQRCAIQNNTTTRRSARV